MNLPTTSTLVLLALLLPGAVIAENAAPSASERDRPQRAPAFDHRYNHDRYYPPRGQIVSALPPGHYVAHWGRSPYYFHGGVWYRPERSHWVVIAPPIGLVVPYLPPFYTTIWAGGIPYYYANDVYYAWRPAQHGYVIVKPPASTAATDSQPTQDSLFIYPKNGQSDEQQAKDRYECHRWAANESGFDPTMPLGGVSQDQTGDKRAAYFRAMTACLEGRGYSVK
jgi:hypothetical protein